MEILQEIGSYAGIAAIVGLAVLSALYFSQARDVKRLREWAGRAPERVPAAAPEPRGVVAQPIARPPSRPVPGGTPPPVPTPPGARPATPGAAAAAAAAAAGAAPAVARGPAPAAPAGAGGAEQGVEDGDDGGDEEPTDEAAERGPDDVTAMDTVVHPPPALPEEDEADDAPDEDAAELQQDELDVEDADSGETDALDDDYAQDTGEWRPEDEHSEGDFTDEHDAVGPPTPAAGAPRPPSPYQRRGGPGPATGYARDRDPILPPYEESRSPSKESGERSSGAGRRPVLLVVAAMVAIAVLAFGVLQLTGDDDPGSGDGVGLSAGPGDDGGSDDGQAASIDPADVTVAVLNGTIVPGLAATIGDQIQGEGFQLGTVTNNFDQQRAESVVLYAPGAEAEAADVARRLGIAQREPVDAESQALAGDASVVVVAGADQNQ